jgi:hypothetical protein
MNALSTLPAAWFRHLSLLSLVLFLLFDEC